MERRKPGQKPIIPESWQDQSRTIPSIEEREALASGFYQRIIMLLQAHRFDIVDSSYRAKEDEKIRMKQALRQRHNNTFPVSDIYGVCIVLPNEETVEDAAITIADAYTLMDTEDQRFPFILDRRSRRSRTVYSDPDYKAVHVYVPFGEDTVYHIGEVQLFTPEWIEVVRRTESAYHAKRDADFLS